MTPTQETALEVGKVLDALAALAGRLTCHEDIPGDQLVLSATDLRSSCTLIGDSVDSLRNILQISEDNGGGAIPREVLDQISGTDNT